MLRATTYTCTCYHPAIYSHFFRSTDHYNSLAKALQVFSARGNGLNVPALIFMILSFSGSFLSRSGNEAPCFFSADGQTVFSALPDLFSNWFSKTFPKGCWLFSYFFFFTLHIPSTSTYYIGQCQCCHQGRLHLIAREKSCTAPIPRGHRCMTLICCCKTGRDESNVCR